VGRVPPQCEFAPCPQRGKDFCTTDNECVCGGIDAQTGDCFVGNKGYYEHFVDPSKDCPDFCTGIAGNRETKCVRNTCAIVQRKEPLPVGPSIEVVPEPTAGEGPLTVNFTAILRGAADDSTFYCLGLKWDFGDGQGEAAIPTCPPYSSSEGVQTRYQASHKYERPGTYTVTFTLGSLVSKPATVKVLPELGPAECDEASDCVPAQCCHAVDCIIKEKVPDCSKAFCTQECRPGTLDCGGSCACINYRCTGKNFQPGKDVLSGPRPWQTLP